MADANAVIGVLKAEIGELMVQNAILKVELDAARAAAVNAKESDGDQA